MGMGIVPACRYVQVLLRSEEGIGSLSYGVGQL